jgi:hypothetical protein
MLVTVTTEVTSSLEDAHRRPGTVLRETKISSDITTLPTHAARVKLSLRDTLPSLGPLAVLALVLMLSGTTLMIPYEPPQLTQESVASPANGTTVVSTQGWNARGYSLPGRPARLVGVGPNGTVDWTHGGPDDRDNWFYDVDPLPNGNVLAVNPVSGTTVVYELDPDTGNRVWTERFDLSDIHDVDLINGDELLVAGINYDQDQPSGDRVFVYNRSREEVTWEWYFRNHYRDDIAGGVTSDDWTHVNDVDQIREGEFLVSPRDFDQVIAINRSTKAIELRLGRDGDHGTLYEQHNPQYLEAENGTPTILVADSENDRVVEYERVGGPPGEGEWEQTWSVSGGLSWPRDADRLPNGNTLIVDSMNHRVIEVTPDGEIVWESAVPWATYDAERVAHGDEGRAAYEEPSDAPTMRDLGAEGTLKLDGGANPGVAGLPSVSAVVGVIDDWTPVPELFTRSARQWTHVVPWFTPTWMPTWSATLIVLALGIVVGRVLFGGIRRGVSMVR